MHLGVYMQKHVGFIFGVDLNDTDLCAAVAVLVYSSESRAFPRARANGMPFR